MKHSNIIEKVKGEYTVGIFDRIEEELSNGKEYLFTFNDKE